MIKAVALRRIDGRIVVERAGIAPSPGGAVSEGLLLDPQAIADSIRKLCREQRLRGKRVAAAISGEEVLLTRLKIERKPDDSLEQLVRQEAARDAPFPMEDAILDFQVLETSTTHLEWVNALAVVVRRGKVERLQDVFSRAGKSAEIVDATACALANTFEMNYGPAAWEITALLHLGATMITMCILRGSAPLLAKDIAMASRPSNSEPGSLSERVVVELERFLEQMDEIADDHPLEPRSGQIRRLLLSGGGARMRGLDELLRARIGIPFEEMNPFLKIEFSTSDRSSRLVRDHAHCMPVAVGLALQGLDVPAKPL